MKRSVFRFLVLVAVTLTSVACGMCEKFDCDVMVYDEALGEYVVYKSETRRYCYVMLNDCSVECQCEQDYHDELGESRRFYCVCH